MKKNKLKIFLKVIVFVAILALLVSIANRVLMPKNVVSKYDAFYTEEEPFDILFFGSSRVLDAFQPMELWEKYHIRSYNMAQHGENLPRDYWQLKNALKQSKPGLVIIDVSLFSGSEVLTDESDEDKAYLHKQIDHMPFSIPKIAMINKLCPITSRMEFYLPFVLYHDCWNEVTLENFKRSSDVRKGAEVRTNIMPQDKIAWEETAFSDVFNVSCTGLDRIIELCREEDVPVLFICMPCNELFGAYKTYNSIEKYLLDNEADYLNIAKVETFLDYSIDFADTSHVNVAGSHKMTDFIGNYYLEHYSVRTVNESVEQGWNTVLENYKYYKDQLIRSMSESPESLLMATYSDDDYYVIVKGNKEFSEKYNIEKFGVDMSIDDGAENTIEIYRTGEKESFTVYSE